MSTNSKDLDLEPRSLQLQPAAAPLYYARLESTLHQASVGVGGTSACTFVAAEAALAFLRGSDDYNPEEWVDGVLWEGVRQHREFLSRQAAGTGVEHASVEDLFGADSQGTRYEELAHEYAFGTLRSDGRSFEEVVGRLLERAEERPAALFITAHAQTVVALASRAPPPAEVLAAARSACTCSAELEVLPGFTSQIALFDSHRWTPERGGPRNAALLYFGTGAALAAYLGADRFPPGEHAADANADMFELQFDAYFARLAPRPAPAPRPRPRPAGRATSTVGSGPARFHWPRGQLQGKLIPCLEALAIGLLVLAVAIVASDIDFLELAWRRLPPWSTAAAPHNCRWQDVGPLPRPPLHATSLAPRPGPPPFEFAPPLRPPRPSASFAP